jgi:hypothetical protein
MLPSQAAMIFSIAISVRLEAILRPRVCNHRQYPWRIGAKFSALRELLVASWNIHNLLLRVVANTLDDRATHLALEGFSVAVDAARSRQRPSKGGFIFAWIDILRELH